MKIRSSEHVKSIDIVKKINTILAESGKTARSVSFAMDKGDQWMYRILQGKQKPDYVDLVRLAEVLNAPSLVEDIFIEKEPEKDTVQIFVEVDKEDFFKHIDNVKDSESYLNFQKIIKKSRIFIEKK